MLPVEARVALAAAPGNTVGETAKLLNLSPYTIKTHLRRVFAKTATARQAELSGLSSKRTRTCERIERRSDTIEKIAEIQWRCR
jgi:DNA-binding CsgD family transcriptional regulator